MKKIQIILCLGLIFLVSSCGYKLSNKPISSSKHRDYPKKIDHSAEKTKNEKQNNQND